MRSKCVRSVEILPLPLLLPLCGCVRGARRRPLLCLRQAKLGPLASPALIADQQHIGTLLNDESSVVEKWTLP